MNSTSYDFHHYQEDTSGGAVEDQATDELLARLDQGIRNTQEEIKLNKLDASIEHSLNLNQVYLDQIKNSLDHLNLLHQKAQKFLSISKNCVQQIQEQQQQPPAPIASSSKCLPPVASASATNDLSAKNLNLVSDQISSISLPWFKHKFGVELPSFEDAKKRDQYNSLLHQQPWQPPERRKLDDEVGAILRQNNHNKDKIDWNRVAQNVHTTITHLSVKTLKFPDRKPIECKIQWTQKQDPSLNKSKWSLSEIDRLFEIVKKFDFKNWDLISKELATGRTPSECVKQFRIVTQEKREWTETDDLLLKEGVSTYGQNWQAGRKSNKFRSNKNNNKRKERKKERKKEKIDDWIKTLRPDIKKGKWDPVEDEALKSAVAACGMVWKDVAPRVRGRTDAQCRERWCNILDPRIVVGNWTPEVIHIPLLPFFFLLLCSQCSSRSLPQEDQKILRMRDVERRTWSEISKSFNGRRTDNHCMRRHSELKRVKDPTMKKQHTQTRTNGGLSLIMSGSTTSAEGEGSSRQGSTERGSSVGPARPNTALGRVLIAADSGYTRRNHHHHHHPLLGSSTQPSALSSSLPSIQPDNHSAPDSDEHPDIISSDPTTAPLPPPPPLHNLPFNRAPNSRLRIVNKRVKYST
ncbi:hypothetical protein VP01_576g6 [Puccinia sorghi]|uniref:Uncharacterized protein n=1 Tax=Puccinia sorghi TaxID=27349 RepID=A0A0L6UJ39_9BASI|nr:hypothetical protein VP01_576g6 [Puccinia sorghi]